jgi:hypothetical protein
MKTKFNKKTAIAFLSVALLFGCSGDFLQIKQLGVTPVSAFYKTDADATAAAMSCYNMLKATYDSDWTSFWLIKESLSDDMYVGGQNSGDQPDYQTIHNFTYGASNPWLQNIYKDVYMLIYRSNLIIDNFTTPTAYQQIVIGEAKAIRAYAYYELTTLYGPVPLVLHPLATSEYTQPNSTVDLLYAQIEKDLNEAITALPVKSKLQAAGSDISRFSSGAAQTLLGRVLLTEKKYSQAATVLNALIATNEYSLYPLSGLKNNDITQLLRKSTNFGKESILEISCSSARANTWSNSYGDIWNDPSRTNPANLIVQLCGPRGDEGFTSGTLPILAGWGFGVPTLELYQAYKGAGDSVRLQGAILTQARLASFGGTLMRPDGSGYIWSCPGLARLKYTTWADETTTANGAVPDLTYGTDFTLFRYADALLMAAEANLQSGNTAAALTEINQVRNRVNLPSLPSLTMDNIKLERRLELSFEGWRYQDLIRWGDAKTVLANQGKLIPSGVLTNGALQFISNSGAGFQEPKNELLPIPINEIQSNPKIHQNPGY